MINSGPKEVKSKVKSLAGRYDDAPLEVAMLVRKTSDRRIDCDEA